MVDLKDGRKPIYRTSSPFEPPVIPKLPQSQHDVLVDLLANMLAPIGLHKSQRPKSKGKHNRKRKRDKAEARRHGNAAPEPLPAITSHILLGFNSVNDRLEKLSAISGNRLGLSTASTLTSEDILPPLIAVFLLRSVDNIMFNHLPISCYTASLAHPDKSPIRLVLLDASAEKRIAEAMGIARVSVLAVVEHDDANEIAGLEALLAHVREHVSEPDAGWLKDAVEGRWLGTRVDVQ